MMRVDVKPLTHWIIYKGYTVRFTARTPERVAGLLTVVDGEQLAFHYDPVARVVHLPGRQITINDYGWETATGATGQADEEDMG